MKKLNPTPYREALDSMFFDVRALSLYAFTVLQQLPARHVFESKQAIAACITQTAHIMINKDMLVNREVIAKNINVEQLTDQAVAFIGLHEICHYILGHHLMAGNPLNHPDIELCMLHRQDPNKFDLAIEFQCNALAVTLSKVRFDALVTPVDPTKPVWQYPTTFDPRNMSLPDIFRAIKPADSPASGDKALFDQIVIIDAAAKMDLNLSSDECQLDSEETFDVGTEEVNKLNAMVRRVSKMLGTAGGNLPGFLQEPLADEEVKALPWKVLLNSIQASVQQEKTHWARWSRRGTPSAMRKGRGMVAGTIKVLIYVDTSGSVSADLVARFFRGFDKIKNIQISYVWFDTQLYFNARNNLPFVLPNKFSNSSIEILGNGGTDFDPPYGHWIREGSRTYDLGVILTDGFASVPTSPSGELVPRLKWCIHSNPSIKPDFFKEPTYIVDGD